MIITLVVLAVVAGIAYVRLSTVDASAYAALPNVDGPGDIAGARSFTAIRQITTTPDGVLRAVQVAAEGTPRTTLVLGSGEDGQMVFETRSLIWGFPDFTTVGMADGALVIHGQAHYGQSDIGVNKARIMGWLDALGPLIVAP